MKAERPDGILVVLDADDECVERGASSRKGLGPELRDRARGKLMKALEVLTRAARARRSVK